MNKEKVSTLLGNRIKTLRIDRKYSQEGFADIIGIHRTYMGAIERGEKNITIVTAKKISDGLHMSLSDLLKEI